MVRVKCILFFAFAGVIHKIQTELTEPKMNIYRLSDECVEPKMNTHDLLVWFSDVPFEVRRSGFVLFQCLLAHLRRRQCYE